MEGTLGCWGLERGTGQGGQALLPGHKHCTPLRTDHGLQFHCSMAAPWTLPRVAREQHGLIPISSTALLLGWGGDNQEGDCKDTGCQTEIQKR